MDEFRAMRRVATGALRECFSGVRPYFIALLVLALMHMASTDVRDLCVRYDAKASMLPLFVYVFNTTYYILVLNFLFLVLVCDLPLRKGHHRYIVLRCGRGIWAGGQILYLLMAATIFLLWIFLATVIVMAGHISFEPDWGQVYYSLARIEVHGSIAFDRTVQSAFSAPCAFLLSFGLQWLLCVLFGLMIYAVNLATGKNVGMILPCVFLLLYFRIAQFIVGQTWTQWISPVYLSRMKYYTGTSRAGVPGLAHTIGFFLTVICAWSIVCVEIARRQRRGIDMH